MSHEARYRLYQNTGAMEPMSVGPAQIMTAKEYFDLIRQRDDAFLDSRRRIMLASVRAPKYLMATWHFGGYLLIHNGAEKGDYPMQQ